MNINTSNSWRILVLSLGVAAVLTSCTDHRLPPDPATLPTQSFLALTDNNQLLNTTVQTLSSNATTIAITGLADPSERILGIDFRPATGQLYGMSSTRLYVINPQSGAARAIGGTFSTAVAGTIAGFDFNPTVDRIRVVSSTGQNLRLNPETGAVQAVDGAVNGAAGVAITSAGYTNNVAGATTTTLYNIDANTNQLYRQAPPNDGTQLLVGPLGLDIESAGDFDIAFDGTGGLVPVRFGGRSELDFVDLGTGRLQKLGDFPASLNIIGLAIPTAPVAFAVTSANLLYIFNPTTLTGLVTRPITGLQPGETLLGIDFRPANGQLYGLGSTSRLYTINTSNGAATALGGPFSTLLNGTDFGFDFNPVPDRIRVVSNTGQNLRLNPNDGTLAAVDGALNPGTPSVTASAYTNNFAGTASTTLFNIDSGSGQLVRQDPPNAGGLVNVGPLSVSVEGSNGFDIGGRSNMAYALLRSAGTVSLYNINLSTGAATPVGAVGINGVRGFALGLGF